MGRNKKSYSEEFKKKCIKELMEGKAFGEVCSQNNVAPSTLSDWKKAFLEGIGNKEHAKTEKKVTELEDQLRKAKEIIGQKELEIELLKKDLRF